MPVGLPEARQDAVGFGQFRGCLTLSVWVDGTRALVDCAGGANAAATNIDGPAKSQRLLWQRGTEEEQGRIRARTLIRYRQMKSRSSAKYWVRMEERAHCQF
jgi:hypothetical protein